MPPAQPGNVVPMPAVVPSDVSQIDAILRIREVFSRQGATAKAVGRKFIVADQDRDDKLDFAEFKRCVERYGITDMTDA